MKLDKLIKEYSKLKLEIDWEKYNLYAICHHSTSIEGSSLSFGEVTALLDEGTVSHGKPIEHHNMVTDHKKAMDFILKEAQNKRVFSESFLKEVNEKLMKSTGKEYSNILGSFDASKGDFRPEGFGVHAGNRVFPRKTKELRNKLIEEVNEQLTKVKTIEEILNLAFDVHFQLVSIHPWADGNGRSSRLIMNYIQRYHDLPLSVVFQEDKQTYVAALEESREKEDIQVFRDFMYNQYQKMLETEIAKSQEADNKKPSKKGGMTFLF